VGLYRRYWRVRDGDIDTDGNRYFSQVRGLAVNSECIPAKGMRGPVGDGVLGKDSFRLHISDCQ
jgi:hypothetical protein